MIVEVKFLVKVEPKILLKGAKEILTVTSKK